MLGNFSEIFVICLFSKLTFKKVLSGIPSEKFGSRSRSGVNCLNDGPIRIQSVCKDMTLGGKEYIQTRLQLFLCS